MRTSELLRKQVLDKNGNNVEKRLTSISTYHNGVSVK
jgi:hypothetical protein